MTVNETARALGITLGHAFRLLYAGAIAGRKVEGRWEVDEAAVREYDLRRRGESTTGTEGSSGEAATE